MTDAYPMGGCEGYIWGRPLINMATRVAAFTGVPEPSVLGVVYITVASKRRTVASRVSASSVATEPQERADRRRRHEWVTTPNGM